MQALDYYHQRLSGRIVDERRLRAESGQHHNVRRYRRADEGEDGDECDVGNGKEIGDETSHWIGHGR